MWIFAIGLATRELAGVIVSRVLMLKRIKDGRDGGESPFDQEDTPGYPYM